MAARRVPPLLVHAVNRRGFLGLVAGAAAAPLLTAAPPRVLQSRALGRVFDDNVDLGSSSRRWGTIYAATGVIGVLGDLWHDTYTGETKVFTREGWQKVP